MCLTVWLYKSDKNGLTRKLQRVCEKQVLNMFKYFCKFSHAAGCYTVLGAQHINYFTLAAVSSEREICGEKSRSISIVCNCPSPCSIIGHVWMHPKSWHDLTACCPTSANCSGRSRSVGSSWKPSLLLEPHWFCAGGGFLGRRHAFFDSSYRRKVHRSGRPSLSVPAVPNIACSSTTTDKSGSSGSRLYARLPSHTWKRGECASLVIHIFLFRNPGVLQNLESWFTFGTMFSNRLSLSIGNFDLVWVFWFLFLQLRCLPELNSVLSGRVSFSALLESMLKGLNHKNYPLSPQSPGAPSPSPQTKQNKSCRTLNPWCWWFWILKRLSNIGCIYSLCE